MALFFAKPVRKAPVLDDDEIVMEGWLEKQSGRKKTWKKRWCVLSPRYFCCFEEERTYDYRQPTAWVRIGESLAPAPDANKTSFQIESVDHTLLLAAKTLGERDIWIASICNQFTHDWEPIIKGARVPEGAICSEVDGNGDCALVARNSRGECGKMTSFAGRTGDIWCHHYGKTVSGEVLVPKAGATVRWVPMKRGDPLPDFAVYAGWTRHDYKVYVGRNGRGEFGKINLENGTFWNLWVHNAHRSSEGRYESGEILAILPAGRLSISSTARRSSADGSAEALLENLEPVAKNGHPFEIWRAEMAKLRNQGNSVAVGAGFASPPLDAILGRGAFGSVWRGHDRRNGELLAVKNMQTKGKSLVHRKVAMNELKIAEKIKSKPHPCIVGLFLVQHFELADSALFMLVMEFCPGGDLQQRLDAAILGDDYTVPDQALTWIGQIFLALEHLHLCVGALIRDLKPGNVVISRSGSAKLTDFGYGRGFTQSDGQWTFYAPPGSPGYIAPEVLCQEKYDQSADLYSFAVLTWVLLSGGVRGESPMPPSAHLTVGPQACFSDFRNDWTILADCLDNPVRGRCRISDEASEMVSALTRRGPSERPKHGEVRQTQFFKGLRVPEFNAEPGAVEAWRWKARADTMFDDIDSVSSLSPSLFGSMTTVGSPLPKVHATQILETNASQDTAGTCSATDTRSLGSGSE